MHPGMISAHYYMSASVITFYGTHTRWISFNAPGNHIVPLTYVGFDSNLYGTYPVDFFVTHHEMISVTSHLYAQFLLLSNTHVFVLVFGESTVVNHVFLWDESTDAIRIIGLCEGNPSVTTELPHERSAMQISDVFCSIIWTIWWPEGATGVLRRFNVHVASL